MLLNDMIPDTPYIVTHGNDSLFCGDLVYLSSVDGSLVICPAVSDYQLLQGGWFDEEALKEHPELFPVELSEASGKYVVTTRFGKETVRRV